MLRSHLRVRAFGCVMVWAALSGALPTWAGDGSFTFTRQDRQALWSRNIELLEKGRSSDIDDLVKDLASDKLYHDPRVSRWIGEYRDSYNFLESQRIKDYDKYVAQAQKHLKAGRVREALILANKALANATDSDAFLKSDWITRLTEAAVSKAAAYRKAGLWRKAHSVYYELTTLFPDNKEFKKGRRECLTHARLDVIYEKDGDWEEMLEGVLTSDVEAALDRIDRFYVEEPDFRAIARSGIEHLLLLCESKVMRETFDGLAKDELRRDFEVRLRARLKLIERSSHVTANSTKEHFRRTLKINRDTVQLPEKLVAYEFAVGALEALDEFTSIIWPVEFREFDKHTRGDFVGVGISIMGGGTTGMPITVVSPLEDTPAYRADIRADDQITHVDGQSLEGMSLTKTVKMITGPIDTKVTLTIHRPSEQRSFDVTLTRALVKIISVKGISRNADDPQRWNCMLDEDMGIAYIRVGSFQENTVEQLRDQIDDVLAEGARGLILDLRFNPGGLLKSAVEMAQLFLSRDDHPVVSTRGLNDAPWSNPKARHDGPYTSLPLIILVNEYSASASEIVSGALQDYHRAVILGERTFGKFSVQKLIRLGGSETHLKLTTARYYLPSGRSLHHEEGAKEWGVMPDVEVKRVPKELYRVRQMWRDRDVLAKAGETRADKSTSSPGAPDETAPDQDAPQTPTTGDGAAAGSSAPDKTTADKTTADKTTTDKTAADQTAADNAKEPANSASAESDGVGRSGEKDQPAAAESDEEDQDKLQLDPDPNELPEVDLQLDTALVLMRLHLLGEDTLRVAAIEQAAKAKHQVRNP